MANVDFRRYRRLVQMLWDPEPSNDINTDQPVWCLGYSYKLSGKFPPASKADQQRETRLPRPDDRAQLSQRPKTITPATLQADQLEGPAISSAGCSPLAHEEAASDGGGWPQAFVDDFRSRFWMTYRSDFETIPKSLEPGAHFTLPLSMRLKSQFGDRGFSSDRGWGCMIRSGQSLLANAMALLRLGRSTHARYSGLSTLAADYVS